MNDGRWRKSSYSGSDTKEGECVEVALDGQVGVRDTKDRDGGELNIPATSWLAFTTQLKS